MTQHKRNASLTTLVRDATDALADYARWPHVEARHDKVSREIAILHDALRGFDAVIPNAIFMKIAADLISETTNRDIPSDGLYLALRKLADLRASDVSVPPVSSKESVERNS